MAGGWRIWCAAALLLLAACAPRRDAQVDAEAGRVFDQLRQNQTAALVARLDPAMRTPAAAANVAAVQRSLPPGAPRRRTAVATTTWRSPGRGETVSTLDEYDYGDRRLLVGARLHRAGPQAAWQVQGLQVHAATAQQLSRNALTVVGKPWWQLLFLACALLSPLLMAFAFWKALAAPGTLRKVLFGVIAFLGLGATQMNWTTGQVSWQLIAINLIGAGVRRGPSAFSPWVVSMTIPVGALLILTGVWANARRLRKRAEGPAAA